MNPTSPIDSEALKPVLSAKFIGVEAACTPFDPPLCLRTMRTRTKTKTIPHYRYGRRIYFDPEEVVAYVRRNHRVEARGQVG